MADDMVAHVAGCLRAAEASLQQARDAQARAERLLAKADQAGRADAEELAREVGRCRIKVMTCEREVQRLTWAHRFCVMEASPADEGQ